MSNFLLPPLLIAGSVASSPSQLDALIATAVLLSLSLIADAVWQAGGRAFGYRVLAGLCKLSLNPDSCATTAETVFLQWEAWSLIGAKLVPEFSIVGPPIAGSLKLHLLIFCGIHDRRGAMGRRAHHLGLGLARTGATNHRSRGPQRCRCASPGYNCPNCLARMVHLA